MIYEVAYSSRIDKIIAKWKKSNPILFKKFRTVIEDISVHPRSGIGHPEALVGGGDVIYSRHITAKDRIIYQIYDDKVLVLVIELEGHYNDK